MDVTTQNLSSPETAAATIQQVAALAVEEVEKVIVGKTSIIRMALASIFSGGHVLIEDIPGVGKTSLAKTLAKSLGLSFKRIQFTPDLLPSDVTGTSVYNQTLNQFEFRPGPVFANLVLADEINRASPKTQSSLLECMEESQVTSDGITHGIPRPFVVVATQNDIELQGTYPLPEAQLDRFMMCLSMGYPDPRDESNILASRLGENPFEEVHPVITAPDLLHIQKATSHVYVDQIIQDWVIEIVTATRVRQELFLGVSPRGSLMLVFAARTLAAMSGRSFVTPDDVKAVADSVLTHRLILKPEMRMRGVDPAMIIRETIDSIPSPVNYAKR